jgi:hypothetical protein
MVCSPDAQVELHANHQSPRLGGIKQQRRYREMIQLTLDLQPKQEVMWRVQIGRYTKGAYKTRCSMTNANQAIRYYHCINIGRGYKKRLVKLEGGKAVTIAKQTS